VTISESTLEVITGFHAVVTRALAAAMQAVTQKNEEVALRVIAMKPEVNRLADSAALHETRRLIVREPNRLPSYTVEVDMLQNLKRIFYFAKRMARVVVPADT
jgi:phosphate:Na+ symporter